MVRGIKGGRGWGRKEGITQKCWFSLGQFNDTMQTPLLGGQPLLVHTTWSLPLLPLALPGTWVCMAPHVRSTFPNQEPTPQGAGQLLLEGPRLSVLFVQKALPDSRNRAPVLHSGSRVHPTLTSPPGPVPPLGSRAMESSGWAYCSTLQMRKTEAGRGASNA